jgi:hypothetical protein
VPGIIRSRLFPRSPPFSSQPSQGIRLGGLSPQRIGSHR